MKHLFRVGVTADFPIQTRKWIEEALATLPDGAHWEYMPDTGPIARADVLDRYNAVIALGLRFPAECLDGIQRLALIARWGVGYDRIDIAACTENNVIVAITPEAVRRPVAEGILALIFALAKNLRRLDKLCRASRWRDQIPRSWSIEGKTLGSIGAGNIARELFKLAQGVGFSRILAYDPFVQQISDDVEAVDLETVLKESDFVAINCPLTDQTGGLIGLREFALMKQSAFLINTARGPIVQHHALVKALQTGQIAGAGLDVFETEPLPADDPLLQLENVIVTPHAIAWTEELYRDNSKYACRNVAQVLKGLAPEHVVNREVLERPVCQAKLAQWRVP